MPPLESRGSCWAEEIHLFFGSLATDALLIRVQLCEALAEPGGMVKATAAQHAIAFTCNATTLRCFACASATATVVLPRAAVVRVRVLQPAGWRLDYPYAEQLATDSIFFDMISYYFIYSYMHVRSWGPEDNVDSSWKNRQPCFEAKSST